MQSLGKSKKPKSTIWREGPAGKTLVATLSGLPYGDPARGTPVFIPNHGQARCSGHTTSGTGVNETIMEVEFTLL